MYYISVSSQTKKLVESLLAPYETEEQFVLRLVAAYQDIVKRDSHNGLINRDPISHTSVTYEKKHFGETLSSKKKPFFWGVENKKLTIYRDGLPTQPYDLQKIVDVLKELYSIYTDNFFSLDNNVADVQNSRPSNETGFGRMLYKHTQSVSAAQVSSQLGPILINIGILKWNGKAHGIQFSCTSIVNELDVEMLEMLLINSD